MLAIHSQARLPGSGVPRSGSRVQEIATSEGHNCSRIVVVGNVVAAIAAASLIVAPGALAQGALDQYSPLRERTGAQPSGTGESSAGALALEAVPGAELGPAASYVTRPSGTGELPFTDYPLTPLIIALLILLAAGVMLRIGVEVHSRWNARG